MQIRKNKVIDGMDKDILRVLYYKNKPLVGSEIARFVGLSPAAISPRLNNLLMKGILKKSQDPKIRKFKRKFKNITKKVNTPRRVYWEIDLK
jgi:DNA-binding MarR family transcriptional regulator